MILAYTKYMLVVGISLSFFYLLFKVLLTQDSNHKWKRLILIFSILISFAIPWLSQLLSQTELVQHKILNVQEIIPIPILVEATSEIRNVSEEIVTTDATYTNWSLIFYCIIIGILLLRWISAYYSVRKWIKKSEIIEYRDFILAIVKESIQPFSFSRHIVISRKDYDYNKDFILLHEEAHIKLNHSHDLVLIELACILQWFNPFIWLLKRELKLVHENQADQAVLNKGIDATQYQLLILKKAVGERRFATANYLTQYPISKRIKMMRNKTNNKLGVVKVVIFILMTFVVLQAFTTPEIIKKVNELPPIITQQDKSKIWLQQWTVDNILNNNSSDFAHAKFINSTKANNTLTILQNRKGDYLIQGKIASKTNLKQILTNFIQGKSYNHQQDPDVEVIKLASGNTQLVNKGVIIYQHDMGTPTAEIEYTLHTIGKSYFEKRNQKSEELYQKKYLDLEKDEKLVIDEITPIKFVSQPAKLMDPSAVILIKIKKDGIYLSDIKCPMDQLTDRINENLKNKSINTAWLKIATGVSQEKIDQTKNQLRKTKIKKINFSLDKPNYIEK